MSEERLAGIDALRVVAFVFVVALHADRTALPEAVVIALETIPRFGVPYFFLVAGYFLKVEETTLPALLSRLVTRLVPIYLFWVLVYLGVHKLLIGDFGISKLGALLIDGGPGYHLWFLPALGISILTVFLLARRFGDQVLLASCLLLFIVGLYFIELLAPFGPALPWKLFRNGPFFGAIFVALGFLIRKRRWRPRPPAALLLLLAGLGVSLGERFVLSSAGLIAPTESINDTLGTLAYGTGAFALAVSLPSGGAPLRALAEIGRYTLGFYCIHLVFLWLVQAMLGPPSGTTLLIAISTTSALSIAATLALSHVPGLARFIR